MTALALDEAERLANAASPGPWLPPHRWERLTGARGTRLWEVCDQGTGAIVARLDEAYEDADGFAPPNCEANAAFIAHARTFVPLAVARIRELEAARARIGEVLSAEGCSCDCGHFDGLIDEHNESCDRCLRCRVEMAMRGGR